MSFAVDIVCALGGFDISVAFEAGTGVTALFGPSGAGKTSVLNMIAGVLTPVRGRIVAEGIVLFDSNEGLDLPTRLRRVGYVFQDGRLFPHMSVRRNLVYGYRQDAAETPYAQLPEVVELLGLGALLERNPQTLSGGEQQRVAIGRA